MNHACLRAKGGRSAGRLGGRPEPREWLLVLFRFRGSVTIVVSILPRFTPSVLDPASDLAPEFGYSA